MTGPAEVGPTMEPAIACRAYLTRRLADRGITEEYLPVGATEPEGEPKRYVLLNQIDSRRRGPLADYLLRARASSTKTCTNAGSTQRCCTLLYWAPLRFTSFSRTSAICG